MSERAIVIVTGGSRGIGAATARLLGREKACVAVNYRAARDQADAVVRDIKASGGDALAVQADVGNEDDIVRLFAETDRAFGSLTGLVNNAGTIGGQKRRVEAITSANIMEVMRVNVAGPLLCAREAIKRMSTKGGGKGGAIVNVSSLGALTGSPHAFIDYAASKGALDTMTIGLAAEVVDSGIRVNAVRPGLIDTDIHDEARHSGPRQALRPEDADRPRGRCKRGGRGDRVAPLRQGLLCHRRLHQCDRRRALTGGPMGIIVSANTTPADPAITEAIADFALSGSFATLPEPVQRESVRTVVNWVGCALGGAPTPTVDAAIKGVQSYSSPGAPRDRAARASRCAGRRDDQLPRAPRRTPSTTRILRPSRIRPAR